LQSGIHFEWFKARCSTLESRFRYTSDTVSDTFPWPQTPTRPQIEAVAREAVALRALRREVMAKDAGILAFLLDLNLACAAREAAGEAITPPGLPLPESEHAAFVTDDCIRV
jgi:hypothetical protein